MPHGLPFGFPCLENNLERATTEPKENTRNLKAFKNRRQTLQRKPYQKGPDFWHPNTWLPPGFPENLVSRRAWRCWASRPGRGCTATATWGSGWWSPAPPAGPPTPRAVAVAEKGRRSNMTGERRDPRHAGYPMEVQADMVCGFVRLVISWFDLAWALLISQTQLAYGADLFLFRFIRFVRFGQAYCHEIRSRTPILNSTKAWPQSSYSVTHHVQISLLRLGAARIFNTSKSGHGSHVLQTVGPEWIAKLVEHSTWKQPCPCNIWRWAYPILILSSWMF